MHFCGYVYQLEKFLLHNIGAEFHTCQNDVLNIFAANRERNKLFFVFFFRKKLFKMVCQYQNTLSNLNSHICFHFTFDMLVIHLVHATIIVSKRF